MIRKTVTIDEKTINELDHYARKEARDFSSALRYALKIGLLALVNPDLTVAEIKDIIEAQVDYETGRVSELNPEDLQMKIYETTKFNKLRTKIKEKTEKEALKTATKLIAKDPQTDKKLKGDFASLRAFKYTVKGQTRRLVYKWEKNSIILFSFGPRESIYK